MLQCLFTAMPGVQLPSSSRAEILFHSLHSRQEPREMREKPRETCLARILEPQQILRTSPYRACESSQGDIRPTEWKKAALEEDHSPFVSTPVEIILKSDCRAPWPGEEIEGQVDSKGSRIYQSSGFTAQGQQPC